MPIADSLRPRAAIAGFHGETVYARRFKYTKVHKSDWMLLKRSRSLSGYTVAIVS